MANQRKGGIPHAANNPGGEAHDGDGKVILGGDDLNNPDSPKYEKSASSGASPKTPAGLESMEGRVPLAPKKSLEAFPNSGPIKSTGKATLPDPEARIEDGFKRLFEKSIPAKRKSEGDPLKRLHI